MFSMFNKKKRQEEDRQRAEEVQKIVDTTVHELKKATRAVEKVNEKAVIQIATYDIAEKLYYATRRGKNV